MPDDAQSTPPTLDYAAVNKHSKRTPTWLAVFLVAFALGLVWPVAIAVMNSSASEWMLFTVYPGQVVHDLFPRTPILAFLAVSTSYGLVALLSYAVYRSLRQWLSRAGS